MTPFFPSPFTLSPRILFTVFPRLIHSEFQIYLPLYGTCSPTQKLRFCCKLCFQGFRAGLALPSVTLAYTECLLTLSSLNSGMGAGKRFPFGLPLFAFLYPMPSAVGRDLLWVKELQPQLLVDWTAWAGLWESDINWGCSNKPHLLHSPGKAAGQPPATSFTEGQRKASEPLDRTWTQGSHNDPTYGLQENAACSMPCPPPPHHHTTLTSWPAVQLPHSASVRTPSQSSSV